MARTTTYHGVVLEDAEGSPISGSNPIEASEPSISGAAAITPHDTTTTTAGRQMLVNCTVAGNVKVKFSDGSTLTIPVAIGLSILPWAVIQVYVTGTTATATYANLL
jgi:hypothetical protein